MGKKKLLIISLVLVFFVIHSCECPKKYEKMFKLTESQKEWFSQCSNNDTTIYVHSDNGLSDFLTFSKVNNSEGYNEISKGNGKCPVYEGYEGYGVSYFSTIAGTYWHFSLTTQNGTNEFKGSFHKDAGRYTSCYFTLGLENLEVVKSFSYYPFSIKQTEGFQLIGDTTINGEKYNDIFKMEIQLPNDVKPLEINKILISKKKGLISYQTFNKVNWYLN